MLRGYFVTGTDTGVGKTVVSAALMHRLRPHVPVRYWKPIQTGIEQDDDTAVVVRLGACRDDEILAEGMRLPRPVSPHLAARLARVTLTVDSVLNPMERHRSSSRWVVEGAGGVLVPLNDRELVIDLIVRLGLPAIIAARSALGTINHTLLTIQALRDRAVPIAGVVMVGPPNEENRKAIERYGCTFVLGELPWLEPLTPEALRQQAAAIDPDGVLCPTA
jgi:dethiobiotin synthase